MVSRIQNIYTLAQVFNVESGFEMELQEHMALELDKKDNDSSNENSVEVLAEIKGFGESQKSETYTKKSKINHQLFSNPKEKLFQVKIMS